MTNFQRHGIAAVLILGIGGLASVALRPVSELPGTQALARLHPGELAVSELRCTACHEVGANAESRLARPAAPLLAEVGARVTPGWLREYLTDPHQVKPGSAMPDLLVGRTPADRSETVDNLVHFLASLGGPMVVESLEVEPRRLEAGRHAYHTLGCVACHDSFEAASEFHADVSSPRVVEAARDLQGESRVALGHLDSKTTVPHLAAFLHDPLATRPSGRMPSLGLSENEAEDIARYLLRGQAESDAQGKPVTHLYHGVKYYYYEAPFTDEVADFDALQPLRTGTSEQFKLPQDRSGDHFGFLFEGLVLIEADGEYTFETRSDDGSRLYINGEPVVKNDGFHGMDSKSGSVALTAGLHSIRVTVFERDGGEGLEVFWAGPGFDRRQIASESLRHRGRSMAPTTADFVLDPGRVAAGRTLFETIGCANCHTDTPATGRRSAKPLLQLAHAAGEGCLAESTAVGVPQYDLKMVQREALQDALASASNLNQPLDAGREAERDLVALRCTNCHERGVRGGPGEACRDYFGTTVTADIGEEGRIPPPLTGIGAKLHDQALRQVLLRGARVRPYITTRMPQYGEANVGHLPELLAEADAAVAEAPQYRGVLAEVGRELVGTAGFSCINCHDLAEHASLGMPAVNLATVSRRIQPGWFREYMLDPMSKRHGTRMPTYWPEGTSTLNEILEGEATDQIDAIWSYLSRGTSMQAPEGMVAKAGEYDLVPTEGPLYVGVFMKGLSPRVLCVGFPERVHVAFDFEHCRLAKVWRGPFIDAKGTWHGRAGALEQPLGNDVFDLPEGAPIAQLETPASEWPAEFGRELGYRRRGRREQDRRPIFQYRYGSMDIDERAEPRSGPTGSSFLRELTIRSLQDEAGVWMRAAVGDSIVAQEPGTFLVNDREVVRVEPPPGTRPRVRDVAGRQELLLPVTFLRDEDGGFQSTLRVEYTW